MISIWSGHICCQFLLTNDQLNQQLSKKLISLFPSSLVMCSYLILWTFLVELLVFLKAYKTEETKGFSVHEWFDNREKLNNKELPPYDSFFSKLRNINPLEKDYDIENLTTSGLSSEQAVCKLRLNKIPPTGDENYAYLRSIWVSEGMKSFRLSHVVQ